MLYGYARCSTDEQRQDIERQANELLSKGAEKIYREYASGASDGRPELALLLDTLKSGDTLAVTEVSRLTRSLHRLCEILGIVQSRNLRLICGTLEIDCTNKPIEPMYKAMLYIMGVFAELERDMTVERIHSGLKNARANGKQLGRPRLKLDDVPEAVKELWPRYQAGKLTKTEYAKKAKVSRPSLYKYIKLLEGGCN